MTRFNNVGELFDSFNEVMTQEYYEVLQELEIPHSKLLNMMFMAGATSAVSFIKEWKQGADNANNR